MTRLLAYLSSYLVFQDAPHSQMVERLKALPKYPAPKRTQNAKVKSFAEWSARYDYRRSA